MSNSPEMALLYKHVIEDVIRNVRAEFINIGVDEQVLQWESKLLDSNVIRPEHFPLSASTSFAQQQQAQQQEIFSNYYSASTSAPMPSVDGLHSKFKTPNGTPLTTPAALSQEEQNIILQQQMRHLHSQQEKKKSPSPPAAVNNSNNIILPQYDGADDLLIKRTEDVRKPNGKDEDDNNLINSDLDDSDEELEAALMAQGVSDILLCQFEKVTRVKSRWRGILRSGLIHLNGSDLAFGKCNLDFQW